MNIKKFTAVFLLLIFTLNTVSFACADDTTVTAGSDETAVQDDVSSGGGAEGGTAESGETTEVTTAEAETEETTAEQMSEGETEGTTAAIMPILSGDTDPEGAYGIEFQVYVDQIDDDGTFSSDNVDEHGDDANTGTDWQHPVLNLGRAVDIAKQLHSSQYLDRVNIFVDSTSWDIYQNADGEYALGTGDYNNTQNVDTTFNSEPYIHFYCVMNDGYIWSDEISWDHHSAGIEQKARERDVVWNNLNIHLLDGSRISSAYAPDECYLNDHTGNKSWTLNNCNFYNFGKGIVLSDSSDGHAMDINLNNVNFYDCDTAIQYTPIPHTHTTKIWDHVNMNGVTMNNCTTGIDIFDSAVLKGITFDECHTCVETLENVEKIENITAIGNYALSEVSPTFVGRYKNSCKDLLELSQCNFTDMPIEFSSTTMENSTRFRPQINQCHFTVTDGTFQDGLVLLIPADVSSCSFTGGQVGIYAKINIDEFKKSTDHPDSLSTFSNCVMTDHSVNGIDLEAMNHNEAYCYYVDGINITGEDRDSTGIYCQANTKIGYLTSANNIINMFNGAKCGVYLDGTGTSDLVSLSIKKINNSSPHGILYDSDNSSLTLDGDGAGSLSNIIISGNNGIAFDDLDCSSLNPVMVNGYPETLTFPIHISITAADKIFSSSPDIKDFPVIKTSDGCPMDRDDIKMLPPAQSETGWFHYPYDQHTTLLTKSFNLTVQDDFSYKDWPEYAAVYAGCDSDLIWDNATSWTYAVNSIDACDNMKSAVEAKLNELKTQWESRHSGYKIVSWVGNGFHPYKNTGGKQKLTDEYLSQMRDMRHFLYDHVDFNDTDPDSSDSNYQTFNYKPKIIEAYWTPVPDFSITKQIQQGDQLVSSNSARAGDAVNYIITVTNTGGVAVDVTVEDILDKNLAYVSDDSGGTYTDTNRKVKWAIDTLGQNKSKVIKLSTKINNVVQK